ncbi:hypothetical protein PRIPAC_78249 [Pristionchus pacificus]|uniref:Glycoside hydrolase n=1 Tax=Pristionchus pacificus TaxID=54126 RepID=A0A2A6CP74_PRIPA|nr:hypothetical protein PRIPAC_78249 [Pristionchus pacificus]|eukprot:PDM79853.1 glycoside hydrolase [Pristionchus pacificus]
MRPKTSSGCATRKLISYAYENRTTAMTARVAFNKVVLPTIVATVAKMTENKKTAQEIRSNALKMADAALTKKNFIDTIKSNMAKFTFKCCQNFLGSHQKKQPAMSAAAPYVQGCYIANWAVYNAPLHKFTPAKIPIGLCTHIFYAFAAVNVTTFEATSSDNNADVTLGNFDALNNLKKQQSGLKTILSFGGWGESQTGIYSVLASDPAKIATFVKSAWAMADEYGFDGIDVDWEYPEANDRFNYIHLLKMSRCSSGGKLLTAAVPGSDNLIGYNTLEMDEYLDLFNIMTYDFYGDDDPEVQHHAAYSETIHSLQLWNLRGASKSKLLMGIPAYGVGWTADVCALGAPASGPADPYNDEAAYYDLVAMTGQVIDTPEGPLRQTTIKGKKKCYGFDNPECVSKKMAFITSQGYAGAFTWSVDMDDAAFDIHYAIKQGLPNGAQSTNIYQPAKCVDGEIRPNTKINSFDLCVNGEWARRL